VSPSSLARTTSKCSGVSRTWEASVMVDAGKNRPPTSVLKRDDGVATANVNALAGDAVLLPFDGGAVGGVLGADAQPGRQQRRPHLAEPDQTDTDHPEAVDEPGPKRSGQQPGQDVRGDAGS